ncbi:hypothetical protein HYX17_02800, partial [Candidatus Woesearchaeota archaeon]|nr:hypothetical protein [Candidatus Woesearchaeota archaeon]
MKIRLILLMLIINVSIALAQIDINILRQDYSPFETLQVEITLNNPTRELLANDVKIDNIKIAPFIVPLEKNKYFVYFDVPDIENNTYNLTVNSRFLINNALTDVTERKEFNVINSNYSLSVKPAILIIDKNNLKESYKIILKNNNYPLDVNIKLDSDFLYPARNTISLLDNEEKNLFIFSKQGAVEEAKIILNYDRIYEIPVIIKSSQIINEENNSIEEAEQKASFITEQPFLTRELAPDEAVSGPLEFRNNLNRNLRIKFYLTDDLNKIIRINTTNIILK